jgi:hypothetical protein
MSGIAICMSGIVICMSGIIIAICANIQTALDGDLYNGFTRKITFDRMIRPTVQK